MVVLNYNVKLNGLNWELLVTPLTDAKDKVFSVFARIASCDGFTEPARFSPEAQALFNEWYIRLNLEIRSNDILPVMESHYGKYKSLIPNLAVLIHLADSTKHSQIIGVSSIKRAIAWGVYIFLLQKTY